MTEHEWFYSYHEYGNYAAVIGYDGNAVELTIPSEVDGYQVFRINEGAFENASFKKVSLPETIMIIGPRSFVNCKNLETIDLGKCPANPIALYYNDAHYSLGINSQFITGCESLKTILVSDDNSLYSIGEYGELIDIDYLNATILMLFPAQSDLEVYDAPESMRSIDSYSLVNNSSLKYLIGNSVKYIDSGSFVGSSVVAAKLSRDSEYKFAKSNGVKLKYIFFDGTEEQWKNERFSDDTNRAKNMKLEGVKVIFEAKDAADVFVDVKSDSWFYGYVDFAMNAGLMKGVSGTKFEPASPMSRAMLVTVLWRLEGEPEASGSTFEDLTESWYKTAVRWAYENGIVKGVTESRFDPDGNVTREQIAAIFKRYADFKKVGTDAGASLDAFVDSGKIESYAKDAMSWAVGADLIRGTGGSKLDPKGNATRAQVATLLRRLVSLGSENTGKRGNNSEESQKIDIESLFNLNGEEYGRLIASSESAEDAVRVCTRHFTDTRYEGYYNTVTDCSVIYESDILYGLNVKWEVGEGKYEENVISIKKNVADITVNNVVYGDKDSFRILTDSKEQIEKVLLYLFKYKSRPSLILSNPSVNGYEFTENDSEYVLTADTMMIVYGDWGLEDKYYYYNVTLTLDKTTRFVEYQKQEITQQ
ncbi:MAG: S-layer homology domain-containing protein [Clostridia bacterium]|nr:S-layer homology domain-containing protein [Clostridia bacterium]